MNQKDVDFKSDICFVIIMLKIKNGKPCTQKELLFVVECLNDIVITTKQENIKLEKWYVRRLRIAKIIEFFDPEYYQIIQGNLERVSFEIEYLEMLERVIAQTERLLIYDEVKDLLEYHSMIGEYESCYRKYYNPNASVLKNFVLQKTSIVPEMKKEKLGKTKKKLVEWKQRIADH